MAQRSMSPASTAARGGRGTRFAGGKVLLHEAPALDHRADAPVEHHDSGFERAAIVLERFTGAIAHYPPLNGT